MAPLAFLLTCALLLQGSKGVSYYEYYGGGEVGGEGLIAEGNTFTLNGKPIMIYSGALHYFRVHPDYWRTTLRKFRAAGLNAVETYTPWNLHEPRRGEYDFGDLGETMSPFLDVRAFIQMAQEEDLFVIFRPGPYICSEWDFGGMPSFLLRDYTMQVRTYYEGFRVPAAQYLDNLLPKVVDLQFTNGGPIIAIQIENEYGHFGYGEDPRDIVYMEFLRDTVLANGFGQSLLFTSDSPVQTQDLGAIPGVLQTANFKNEVEENLDTLLALQPDRPLMVMEYWSGWFDHWLSGVHIGFEPEKFADCLERILAYNSSVNFYMFIGGTNFGFMAGANLIDVWPHYAPIVSSYDYDAILTEAGDYTIKYNMTRDILSRHNPLQGTVTHPSPPEETLKAVYPSAAITHSMEMSTLLSQHQIIESSEGLLSMEELPINNENGQSYGYVFYITYAFLSAPNSTLKIKGHVRDMAQVFVNAVEVTNPYSGLSDVSGFGFWDGFDKELEIPGNDLTAEVSILVENLGRVNYGEPHKFHQKKGLWEGPVLIDGVEIDEWKIVPMEFTSAQVNSFTGWINFTSSLSTPALYRSTLTLTETPRDSWVDMSGWGKGVVFVNGFNLGRYWCEGPPKTLYIPAPLLHVGDNEFVVFEQYTAASSLVFTDTPILGLLG